MEILNKKETKEGIKIGCTKFRRILPNYLELLILNVVVLLYAEGLIVRYLGQKLMNELIGTMVARNDVEAPQSLVDPEERKMYGTSWVPAPYKLHFIKEFTKNVLMK